MSLVLPEHSREERGDAEWWGDAGARWGGGQKGRQLLEFHTWTLLPQSMGLGEPCSFHEGQLRVTENWRDTRDPRFCHAWYWGRYCNRLKMLLGLRTIHETRNTCWMSHPLGPKLLFLFKILLAYWDVKFEPGQLEGRSFLCSSMTMQPLSFDLLICHMRVRTVIIVILMSSPPTSPCCYEAQKG